MTFGNLIFDLKNTFSLYKSLKPFNSRNLQYSNLIQRFSVVDFQLFKFGRGEAGNVPELGG